MRASFNPATYPQALKLHAVLPFRFRASVGGRTLFSSALRAVSSALRAVLRAVLLAVLLTTMLGCDSDHSTSAAKLPEVIAKAPTFTLTRTDNTSLSSAELVGKVWLMNFFFASCPGPCPLINTELKKLTSAPALQGAWARDSIRLLSVTVDPARDTPERLAEYAKRYGAQRGAWDFLTGSEADIRTLIEGGFKLVAPDDVSMHTTRIALVDQSGDVRGLYQATDQESVKQMFRDVVALSSIQPTTQAAIQASQ